MVIMHRITQSKHIITDNNNIGHVVGHIYDNHAAFQPKKLAIDHLVLVYGHDQEDYVLKFRITFR